MVTTIDPIEGLWNVDLPTEVMTFGKVAVDRLRVDHRYQRTEKPRFIRQIAARWTPELVGVIQVSLREDDPDYLYVLDGQQRVAAARLVKPMAPVLELYAQIFEGLTPAKEALISTTVNRRRVHWTSLDEYKADVMRINEDKAELMRIEEQALTTRAAAWDAGRYRIVSVGDGYQLGKVVSVRPSQAAHDETD